MLMLALTPIILLIITLFGLKLPLTKAAPITFSYTLVLTWLKWDLSPTALVGVVLKSGLLTLDVMVILFDEYRLIRNKMGNICLTLLRTILSGSNAIDSVIGATKKQLLLFEPFSKRKRTELKPFTARRFYGPKNCMPSTRPRWRRSSRRPA